jgi:hypothetical protein
MLAGIASLLENHALAIPRLRVWTNREGDIGSNARDLWSGDGRSRTASKTMVCPRDNMRHFDAIGVRFPSHVSVIETEGARTDNLLQFKPHIPEFQRTQVSERK